MSGRWLTADLDEADETSFDQASPTLVSLHFIRSALRRRWVACLMSALLGLLAAVGYLLVFPQPDHAKAVVVLAHQEGVDPTEAMSTDIGLLLTQTVAARTIATLGLTLSPEDLLSSVEAKKVSPEVLSLTLAAPTEAEATRRLAALTSVFLTFRGEQLTLQSKVLVDGMQVRVERLQGEVAVLTGRIAQLSASKNSNAKLNDTITQRAHFQTQIDSLEEAAEELTLRNTAVVASSRIVDPATADQGGVLRTTALIAASGLIGGTALGCGVVLFLAITSDRLRRRSDVAGALGTTVPVSVGHISPVRKIWRWVPPLHILNRRRDAARQRLAHAFEEELLLPQGRGRLAIACLDNANEVGFAVAAAAKDLAALDRSVTVLDLTERLSRSVRLASSSYNSPAAPVVLRPRGLPPLANGAADLLRVGHWDEGESTPSPELTDLTLVLAELDPAVGADHLTAWVDRVVVVVTAGRSSVEKVRTVGDMVRSAGLDLRFAVLLHTEPTDDSSRAVDRPAQTAVQLLDEPVQPAAAPRSEAR